MFIDGFRVWKGKDNYKPCREIYKGLYMVRPAWYVKNHLDNIKSDVLASIDASKIMITKNEEISKDMWRKSFDKIENDAELQAMPKGKKRNILTNEKYSYDANVCNQLERVQNNSMVISIFSYLEWHLWQVCREMEICLETKVKLKHISKNEYLKNYMDYLENIADIDCRSIKKHFSKINNKKFIRNRIIHNLNTVVDSRESKKLEKIDGIKFHQGYYDDHHFYVQKEFLLKLLEEVKELFESIFEEIEKRIFSGIHIQPLPNNIILTPVPPEKK